MRYLRMRRVVLLRRAQDGSKDGEKIEPRGAAGDLAGDSTLRNFKLLFDRFKTMFVIGKDGTELLLEFSKTVL